MDESAQQAVQLGFNVTVFIIALSISINLLMGVRDVADVASEYDASIPSGSRVVTVQTADKRTISGYELLSYYANYMTEVNHNNTNKFYITIENGSNILSGDLGEIEDIKEFFKTRNISLDKKYEVITEEYNAENEILHIKLKVVD